VFLATYWLIYHGGSGGLHFNPPGSVRSMTAIQYAESRIAATTGRPLFWLGASVVGLLGFCGATLAGIPAALASPALRRARSAALLIAMLLASFVPFLLLTHKGGSQNFFTYYGLAAGCIVSAWGLALVFDRAQPVRREAAGAIAAAIVGWLGLLLAATILPYVFAERPRLGPLYALWLGLPAAVIGVLGMLAWRGRRSTAALYPIALGAVVLTGFLDTPLHTVHFLASALRVRSTPYARDSPGARGLTPELQQALAWIRRHTPPGAVIAVNNQFSDAARQSPDYYYYSAFGERRVFLEGWEDTIADADQLNPTITPFPERLRLNDAVFAAGDPSALALLERKFAVRYLLVDRAHGPVQPRLASLARVVFANRGAIVYRVG
jgi:hypothetical protein